MVKPGQHTHEEILSQPETWSASLQRMRAAEKDLSRLWNTTTIDQIIFTGCGSTYYLSVSAAEFAQATLGIPCLAYPASELWFNPELIKVRGGKTLLVAASRSARTSETYNAMSTFRKLNAGPILTINCFPNQAWSQLSDETLLLPEAQEESMAQTRSFTSMYVAAQMCAALWGDNQELAAELEQLPEIVRRLLEQKADVARRLGSDSSFDRFYFLGTGARYGLACELSLKMKEMSLSHSEPFHFMEFRHGPKAMVGPNTLIIGLVSESYEQQERKVLEEMKALGATVLAIGEKGVDVNFDSILQEPARNALYLPLGQLLAYEHAIAKGLNPDRIQNLKAVVEL